MMFLGIKTSYWVMILYVLVVLSVIAYAVIRGRILHWDTLQAQAQKKPKKSKQQRIMERKVFRKAKDAGASDAEALKVVHTYTALQQLKESSDKLDESLKALGKHIL